MLLMAFIYISSLHKKVQSASADNTTLASNQQGKYVKQAVCSTEATQIRDFLVWFQESQISYFIKRCARQNLIPMNTTNYATQ